MRGGAGPGVPPICSSGAAGLGAEVMWAPEDFCSGRVDWGLYRPCRVKEGVAPWGVCLGPCGSLGVGRVPVVLTVPCESIAVLRALLSHYLSRVGSSTLVIGMPGICVAMVGMCPVRIGCTYRDGTYGLVADVRTDSSTLAMVGLACPIVERRSCS